MKNYIYDWIFIKIEETLFSVKIPNDKKEAKLKELNKEIRELKKINQEVERLIASESATESSSSKS